MRIVEVAVRTAKGKEARMAVALGPPGRGGAPRRAFCLRSQWRSFGLLTGAGAEPATALDPTRRNSKVRNSSFASLRNTPAHPSTTAKL